MSSCGTNPPVPGAALNDTGTVTDREIAGCFNAGVGRLHAVRLIGGAAEPFYQPAGSGFATIRYTRDFAASALHEVAHWCIAGRHRRRLTDYGYWYRPPPRNDAQQSRFMEVELEAQALESIMASVCGLPFQVSLDRPDAHCYDPDGFADRVAVRAIALAADGSPPRAVQFCACLQRLREAKDGPTRYHHLVHKA